MRVTLLVHIIAGGLGLIMGYVAPYTAQGATLHRRSGMQFVYAMLTSMSFALFIAALSFFMGQAKVIPAAIRIPPLLAFPVLAVLGTMFYWLWRVRRRPPVAIHTLDPSRRTVAGVAGALPIE